MRDRAKTEDVSTEARLSAEIAELRAEKRDLENWAESEMTELRAQSSRLEGLLAEAEERLSCHRAVSWYVCGLKDGLGATSAKGVIDRLCETWAAIFNDGEPDGGES